MCQRKPRKRYIGTMPKSETSGKRGQRWLTEDWKGFEISLSHSCSVLDPPKVVVDVEACRGPTTPGMFTSVGIICTDPSVGPGQVHTSISSQVLCLATSTLTRTLDQKWPNKESYNKDETDGSKENCGCEEYGAPPLVNE